jgi:hypothetical protein
MIHPATEMTAAPPKGAPTPYDFSRVRCEVSPHDALTPQRTTTYPTNLIFADPVFLAPSHRVGGLHQFTGVAAGSCADS